MTRGRRKQQPETDRGNDDESVEPDEERENPDEIDGDSMDNENHLYEKNNETILTDGYVGENVEKDTTEMDDDEVRRRTLVRTYNEKLAEVYNADTMNAIKRTMDLHKVINKVKFVRAGDELGTFKMPDFTNEGCWQSIVWNSMSFQNLSDGRKARKWMTYLPYIKKLFSDYKTSVTSNQKEAFLKCK